QFLPVVFLFICCCGHSVRAETISVSGNVQGLWSADTVLVTGEIRIPSGASLTIRAGVNVLFQSYSKFIVDNGAALVAVGTNSNWITFREFNVGEKWWGIRFLAASNSSRLEYCRFLHGKASGSGTDACGGAIYCENTDMTIQNCAFDSCSATGWSGSGGAIYCSNSAPIIRNCSFTANYAEYGGGGVYCFRSHLLLEESILSNNSADYGGGAIYCYDSDPTINDNQILDNAADWGGGIYCSAANPIISGNLISGNHEVIWGNGGGIFCVETSTPVITDNVITENTVTGFGAGIYCFSNANALISENTITLNYASSGAGGIFCKNSSPLIQNNEIRQNASYRGGGIYCYWSGAAIKENRLIGNDASYRGGGMYLIGSTTGIEDNVFSFNTAASGAGMYFDLYYPNFLINNTFYRNFSTTGGGIYLHDSSPSIINCILWENTPQQIYLHGTSNPSISYSDIQNGWTGTGNIAINPIFLRPQDSDFRLQWGSPCIDTGNPDDHFYDPDSTIGDIGAHFFDQSILVNVQLTPHDAPVELSINGGDFGYSIALTNIDSVLHASTVWCEIITPTGGIIGPVLGPVAVNIGASAMILRNRSQAVAPGLSIGEYVYKAYVVAADDTASDSFEFTIDSVTTVPEMEFSNTSNPVNPDMSGCQEPLPDAYSLWQNVPNPFNPSTRIGFVLPEDALVNLEVFDLAGRRVGVLVNGWRSPGYHGFVFDGSSLAAGVYFYSLTATSLSSQVKFVAVKKMLLVK
ncbi:MAG: right-handed parallel beta-helix repeat-containing protein, partial [bacterium]